MTKICLNVIKKKNHFDKAEIFVSIYKTLQIFLVLFHQCVLQVKIRLKCHVHVTFSYFIKRLQQKYEKQYKLCKYLHFHFKMSSTFMKLLNCNYPQQRTHMAFI